MLPLKRIKKIIQSGNIAGTCAPNYIIMHNFNPNPNL